MLIYKEASPERTKALAREIRSAVAQYLVDHPDIKPDRLRRALQDLVAGTDTSSLGDWILLEGEKEELHYSAFWIGNEHTYYTVELSISESSVRVVGLDIVRERVTPNSFRSK